MTETNNSKGEEQNDRSARLPAWISPTLLSSLAALLAAAMPITAYINGRYSIEVEREKFLAELRLKYVDRAIDKERDPVDRERFLQFLVETTDPSDLLHRWGVNELKKAQEIHRLRDEITTSNEAMREISFQLDKLKEDEAQKTSAALSREQLLRSSLDQTIKQRARLERSLRELERRTNVVARTPSSVTAAMSPHITSAELVWGAQGDGEIRIYGTNFGSPGGLWVISEGRENRTIDSSMFLPANPPEPNYKSRRDKIIVWPDPDYKWSHDKIIAPIPDTKYWRGRLTIAIRLKTGLGETAEFSFETVSTAPNQGPQADG